MLFRSADALDLNPDYPNAITWQELVTASVALREYAALLDQEPACQFVKADNGNYPVLHWEKGYVAKIGDKFLHPPTQGADMTPRQRLMLRSIILDLDDEGRSRAISCRDEKIEILTELAAEPAPEPLTDEQINRHALLAKDCPPNSAVMLVSSIRRLAAAQKEKT